MKEGKGFSGLFGSKYPATIEDCLRAFTADEMLADKEAFQCDVCDKLVTARKYLRVHRFPPVLVLHIKYSHRTREKIAANVQFPLTQLDLNPYASEELGNVHTVPSYDLFAVCNHFGSLAAGHYTAHCKVRGKEGREQWVTFNDDKVTPVTEDKVASPNAYILFYCQSRMPGIEGTQ